MTNFAKSMKFAVVALALLIAAPVASQAQPVIPIIPNTHPRILLVGAELQRMRNDLTGNLPAATRFRNMVDGQLADANYYGYEPWYSAMIGVIQGTSTFPQYCAHAVTTTEAFVASEEALVAGGDRPAVAGDSYLEVGGMVGNVALVYDWCYANLSPAQRTRWMDYASRAIANVWDPDNATWGGRPYPWSGWSINNPVNNYYYSFLRATMLYGLATKYERADADGWIAQFRTSKIGNQLAPLFNSDLVGGGSREGTGYGTAMKGLFNLYYLWEKTTGERIADLTTHTRASMPYLLHSIVPTRDRIAPIGDHARDSTATFYDYQRESLLALATLYAGTPVARRTRAELALSSLPEMSSAFNIVYDYLYAATDPGAAANLNTVYRGAGTGHIFARTAWTTNATWLGFLAGPYTESHAHQDGLSILLFKNGWLVNDANMQSHSGIQQGQESHALVTQRVGGQLLPMYEHPNSSAQLTALSHRPLYLYAAANQGTLFNHPNTGNPGAQSKREIVFLKPDVLIVFDRVQYTPGASIKTFQLPTPYLPAISGRSATVSNGTSSLKLHAVAPASATLTSIALPAIDADFNDGYRIDVSVTGSGETKFMNVLAIDNAATLVTGSPTDSGEVTIALADGRSVLLRFNAGAPGGSIEIRNSGGQVLVSEPFASTVETLAETIPTQETLTVTRSGTGAGTVTSLPAGINCGVSCTGVFDSGTIITLSATANGGSTFTGWTGAGCSGTGTCQVTLGAATSVDASFALIPLTATGAPIGLIGTPGNGQLAIGFTPPASNGGAPITGYTLNCTAGVNNHTATGANTPLALTGLTNGTAYDCSVTASNSVGPGPASASVTVTPIIGATLTLVGVQSRKVHGSAGTFDLPVKLNEVINGAITVEPRTIGAGHTLRFQFNDAITSIGSATVTDAALTSAGTATPAISGNAVVVTLTGVSDNKRVTVSVLGVNSVGGPNFSVSLGFLVGDVNHSLAVNASDISAVKAHATQTTAVTNFNVDLNADGVIGNADISAVKARSGLAMP
ncbi:MAG: fibronectin type III domain-containing protein [Betaproteobacteria bacterium]|nr:fibronectin type III domain-containing protein [Betaproteobacteria bacterium]